MQSHTMYRVWINRPWQCDIDNIKINKYEKMFFLYKCDVNFVYLIQKMVFFSSKKSSPADFIC